MSFAYFDWIAHHAEVRGDRTALVDLAAPRRLTYRAFDERIDRLASHPRHHRSPGIGHCRERLARFKCPLRIVFINALPRNATGKVYKPTLRAKFLQEEEIGA